MTPFELAEPKSLRKALQLLDTDDPAVRAFGGCTALMQMMKSGVFHPSRLVSLQKVEKKYSKIALADDVLRIGALATLSSLAAARAVKKAAPVIIETLRTLSNVRVRNVATLGGHLAHGDPHMDLPPVLIALDAELTAVSASAVRDLTLADLYTGYYETALARNELITEVRVPVTANRRAAYVKCTTRSADDWPTLGIAVALTTAGAQVADARLVVSAATEKPLRLVQAEAVLRGNVINDGLLARAGEAAAAEVELMSDAHGSAAYKRELLRVHLARAVRKALAA